MNREELQNIIKKEIQAVAFDYLKELNNQKKVHATTQYLKSSNVGDDDFDNIFFHGGQNKEVREERKRGPITIRENVNTNLKITTGEIKEFENSFSDILDNIPGASIVFDKQKNGYSIIATKRSDGVEAKASGIINLGENGKVIWSYSILNGFNLNAQNLKLSDSNKTMFEALSNHYNDWQKNWREKLNLPSGASEPAQDANTISGDNASQLAPPVSGGMGNPVGATAAGTPSPAPAI